MQGFAEFLMAPLPPCSALTDSAGAQSFADFHTEVRKLLDSVRSKSPPEDKPGGAEGDIDVGSQLWKLLREGEGRVGEVWGKSE